MSKTESIVGVNSGLVDEQGGHSSNESSPHRPPTLRNTLLYPTYPLAQLNKRNNKQTNKPANPYIIVFFF